MTITESDRTAADVAWDIEPLVDGRAEEGVDALLDDAEQRAHEVGEYRGRIGDVDAGELATLMQRVAAIGDLVGRAGSYAGLRFAVDTQDPANGALLARTEERSTTIGNELIFVELEWAEVDESARPRSLPTTSSRSAGITSSRPGATGRTCSPSPKR